ncbi:MAG: hypothetical protein ACREOU_05470 [Candidatus Eiseniibacteriota bacterium]
MKTTRSGLALFAIATLAGATLAVAPALATPTPNGAEIRTRIFNDCPTSVVTTVNSYPAQIIIDDAQVDCPLGFANRHAWSFSEDGGVTSAAFANFSAWKISAIFTLSGATQGEGGLRISPWFSQYVDGTIMCRTNDGEISVFGGRLPFYNFTAAYGIHYVKGTSIYLEALYIPNGLSMASPATIEYRIVYGGSFYSSGPLAFDEGNPAEDPPYGLWGILNDARVGGWVQVILPHADGGQLRAEWGDIKFENLDRVDAEATSWGRLKGLYR